MRSIRYFHQSWSAARVMWVRFCVIIGDAPCRIKALFGAMMKNDTFLGNIYFDAIGSGRFRIFWAISKLWIPAFAGMTGE